MKTFVHLFSPRKSNNRRARVIHPEGYLLFTALAMIVHFSIRIIPAQFDMGAVLGYASDITTSKVIELTNARREKLGLTTLTQNSLLSRAAEAKAKNMFKEQYWAHYAPDGTSPWFFVRSEGYSYVAAGENLGKDFSDSESLVQAWMDSPTHRDNLLQPRYTEIGVAVVNGELFGYETTLVVQLFGEPSSGKTQAQLTAQAASTEQASAGTVQSEQATPGSPVPALPTSIEPNENPQTVEEVSLGSEGISPKFEQASPQSLQLTQSSQLVQGTRSQFSVITTWLESQPLLNPVELSRVFFIVMLGLLMIVLSYDFIHSQQHQFVRAVGKNLAHLMLLSIILFAVLMVQQGSLI